MNISARNALKGTVTDIAKGQIVAKVKVDVGGQTVCSIVSVEAVDDLGLKVGDEISAIVKATEVMLAK
ncbi:molybdenum-pterin-binding protein [Roseospira marina]|uniref:Molybdenum-pterin-binding protein n=1 Tax=Roseospira marina TaxID=140057 RepID=A0A5M6IFU3_9PROT|nr:TOBE domain-containing protein [Roseospira marina]KAA5606619.1 molybdenum-pterin-binding protein [Roseospira marina]MBB4313978.1 molybdopterin-binding protein [Roseospira marina]MBB5087140.1 molybdopterin-binding protein [Roseospira marina]